MTAQEFRDIRKQLGLSQAGLAQLLGYVRTPSVSDLERGVTTITPTIERLMRAYEAGYRPIDWPLVDG
jgi:transcriptional regulator with XRE-family HTH domain